MSTEQELRDAIYDEVTKNSFTVEDSVVDLLDEIIRLREQLSAIDTLHKQWAVKFLSGYERAQQIIDALTEILHKKEDA